jgi:hypothetical protein
MKDPRPWLEKNLRITEEVEGSRIRFTFRAGTRAEQVVILNALLRVPLRNTEESIKFLEESIQQNEESIRRLEKRIESGQQPRMIDTYRKGIDDLRSNRIPALRAEIAARRKQFAVIKWAK